MRIVAFAYACEPDKGSEPAAGWGWARMLADLGETWVITRENNRGPIEAALPSVPERERLHFIYYDLSPGARRWKRGQRGVRLYYLLWQVGALRVARRLHSQLHFDLAWHITLANAWLGSLAGLTGPRFILGPVGGGVGTRWRLLPSLGFRGAAYEILRAAARAFGRYLNPLSRLSWRLAALILVQNPETLRWLPATHRSRACVFPHTVLERDMEARPSHLPARRNALFAGRLLAWKGVALAVRAIGATPDWHLVVCGEGPEAKRIRRLVHELGLRERVDLRGWVPRAEVWRLMREESDAFLFPSLHDEGSFAVAEALGMGLPVVCLAIGGPGWMTRGSPTSVSPAGAPHDVAARLAREGLSKVGRGVEVDHEDRSRFALIRRAQALRALLETRGFLRAPTGTGT